MLSLLAVLLLAHPNSASESVVSVEGRRATVALAFQVASALEVLDADDNGDGILDDTELAAHGDALGAYLLEHYRLYADSLGASALGRTLTGRVAPDSLRLTAPDFMLGAGQRIELQLVFEDRAPITDLLVEMDLFLETSPRHFDVCRVRWLDAGPVTQTGAHTEARTEARTEEALLSASRPSHYFRRSDAGHPRAFVLNARLGIDHILTGYDHLAFLAALLVGVASLRALLGVVTAFTAAHSLTLALAALGVVTPPVRIVELVIALSIAYVAAENLLRGPGRRLWPEAFIFGLVHGLGFAGFLREFMQYEPEPLVALLGFNVGVELGQLAFVVPAAFVLRLCFRSRDDAQRDPDAPPRSLAPRRLRLAASVVICALALYWFARRAWFP